MKIKKRDLIVGYLVAGTVGGWIIVKMIFAPFHEKLANLGQEVRLEEERLKKGISLVENRDAINKEYGKYESYFSVQNISDEEAVATFLKEIERVGREAGVTVLDMKPQKETEADKFSKQYPITLKAEANMKQLVSFLYGLHSSPLLISVEKMVISPKSELTDVLAVSFTFAGVSFLSEKEKPKKS